MSVRSMMTMTARILRDTQTAEDGFGHKGPPTPEVIGETPCRVWYSSGYLARRNQSTVSIRDLIMVVPLGTDIKVGDTINSVWDRRGRELFSKLKLETPMQRANHIECKVGENA